MFEPIVILTEILPNHGNKALGNGIQADHLVVGKGQNIPLWFAFGNQFWYFNLDSVKKLYDYCSRILDAEKIKTFEIPSDPASLDKAENPIRKESDGSYEDYR
jgi:hypothetical protein